METHQGGYALDVDTNWDPYSETSMTSFADMKYAADAHYSACLYGIAATTHFLWRFSGTTAVVYPVYHAYFALNDAFSYHVFNENSLDDILATLKFSDPTSAIFDRCGMVEIPCATL